MIKKISSSNNAEIKSYTRLLKKSKARKESNIFLIEGIRELNIAIKNNYSIKKIMFNPNLIDFDKVRRYLDNKTEVIEINDKVFKKVSYRSGSDGIIAIANKKNHDLNEFKLKSKSPLILVLDGIEKPGNIGALLRTSDAANLDAIFIVNQKTDLYNSNIIRSSLGCLFSNNIILTNSKDTISYFNKHSIKIFSTSLNASKEYQNIKYNQACAIVLGAEDNGISEIWKNESDELIHIPMQGSIDSLNVSNSGAIIVYEAKRQRKFK